MTSNEQQKYLLYGVLVLAVGLVIFMARGGSFTASTAPAVNSNDTSVIKIAATINNRAYNPTTVEVPLGSTVELTVTNKDNEQHGLGIQDFGVNDFVGPKQTKTVRFVANKKGEIATFCSLDHPEKLIINVI